MTDLQNLIEVWREIRKELKNTPVSSPKYMELANQLHEKKREMRIHPDRNEA